MLTRELSSLQHPFVKHLVKLHKERNYRYQQREVLLSGIRTIKDLSAMHSFKCILIEKGYAPQFSFKTEETFVVNAQILKKVTGLESPEPIAAVIAMPEPSLPAQIRSLLVLNGISDPGNLGTLLRTALALGWDGAFMTPGTTDPYNDKALRAAKGATFNLPLHTGTWEELRTLLDQRGITLYAADLHGTSLPKNPPTPYALALGNESHGLQSEIQKKAQLITIPMSEKMESLNVASAGAILMHALRGTP
ncbi:MAG: RNA methyltransferase [Chlamydiota bacterium]